jgi:hypothetical protein
MATSSNKKEDTISIKTLMQIIIGVAISTIVGIGATVYTLNGKIERLDEQVKTLKEYVRINPGIPKPPNNDSVTIRDPGQLANFIKAAQDRVKLSNNENDCFTEADLIPYKEKVVQGQVVNELMNNNSFIDLIISIKSMPASARQTLLTTSREIAKPTWAQLGRISSEGQTVAGRKAELYIAEAIVDRIKEEIKLSVDELKKKYK